MRPSLSLHQPSSQLEAEIAAQQACMERLVAAERALARLQLEVQLVRPAVVPPHGL